jgi:hypothetical protein
MARDVSIDSPVQKLIPRQFFNCGSEKEVYLHKSAVKIAQMVFFVLRLTWGCFIAVVLSVCFIMRYLKLRRETGRTGIHWTVKVSLCLCL